VNRENFFVSVTDLHNCHLASDTVNIHLTSAPTPEICIVTVDSTTSHNLIVWDKPVSLEISSLIFTGKPHKPMCLHKSGQYNIIYQVYILILLQIESQIIPVQNYRG